MSPLRRSLLRSLVAAPLAASLLAACAVAPTGPERPAPPGAVRRFQIDSLLLVDPRGYVPRGLDISAVRIDSVDVALLIEVEDPS